MNRASVMDRLPPQNLEAEQSALGSMLLDKTAAERVLEVLMPEDFYREAHQRIFTAMWDLAEQGEPVDIVTASEELRRRNLLDSVGGITYLTTLLDSVPTAANAEYYAHIVEEKAILRRLIEASHEIAAMAYDPLEDIDVTVNGAENAIFKVAQRRVGKNFYPLRDLMVESWELLSAQAESDDAVTGVNTGFEDLNYQTSGFQPSDLVIVAARPSMGKTAFCLSIAVNAARNVKPDRPSAVAIFSLEMSKEQLAMRMLCSEAGVSSHRLRTGFTRDGDWEKISDAMGRLSELPVFIDDSSDITVMQMRSKCRRLAAEGGIGMIVVDYMQLVRAHGRAENRNQELSVIARALKSMAKEFNVPVVALSQLSRAVEKREDKRPILSDLRESGAIEAEADLVAFIHRPKYYDRGADDGEGIEEELNDRRVGMENTEEAEIIIAKHRNGPVGTVKLGFQAEYARFVNLARYERAYE
jgi:replicative DNA helicase